MAVNITGGSGSSQRPPPTTHTKAPGGNTDMIDEAATGHQGGQPAEGWQTMGSRGSAEGGKGGDKGKG
eukprot:11784948-Heterocapsa_arctica.AAC.1